MREIEFRAKLKADNGEHKKGDWVFGDLVRLKDGKKISTMIYGFGEVDPETVGQYTGLTDKNGKRIFEGDIVKFCTELKEICFVDYGKGKYILRQLKKDKHLSWQSIDIFELFGLECEVIGNIHDNPELMKGAGQ